MNDDIIISPEIASIKNPILRKIRILYEQGPDFIEQAREAEKRYKLANPLTWYQDLGGSLETEVWLRKFITCHPTMLKLKEDCRKMAPVEYPVLIQGETGTGKELLARALHGGRAGPFKAINITNLPAELLESELFGHVRGAFTGANEDKVGLFKSAQNGTVFLDEIGDMPPNMQAKLLRALQDKKARRLGDNNEYEWNARIIAATNADLDRKEFRCDLKHRLNVLKLKTLPLRERLEDIPLIVESIDKGFPKDFKWFGEIPLIMNDGEQVMKIINHLEGNVRSIQAIIIRWQVLGRIEV
jgi:transcriptional regulator with PAS, ATPase and Fis domain